MLNILLDPCCDVFKRIADDVWFLQAADTPSMCGSLTGYFKTIKPLADLSSGLHDSYLLESDSFYTVIYWRKLKRMLDFTENTRFHLLPVNSTGDGLCFNLYQKLQTYPAVDRTDLNTDPVLSYERTTFTYNNLLLRYNKLLDNFECRQYRDYSTFISLIEKRKEERNSEWSLHTAGFTALIYRLSAKKRRIIYTNTSSNTWKDRQELKRDAMEITAYHREENDHNQEEADESSESSEEISEDPNDTEENSD